MKNGCFVKVVKIFYLWVKCMGHLSICLMTWEQIEKIFPGNIINVLRLLKSEVKIMKFKDKIIRTIFFLAQMTNYQSNMYWVNEYVAHIFHISYFILTISLKIGKAGILTSHFKIMKPMGRYFKRIHQSYAGSKWLVGDRNMPLISMAATFYGIRLLLPVSLIDLNFKMSREQENVF